MAEVKHFKIRSNRDGLELGVSVVMPEKEPIGIVQLSHGMVEYRGRYLEFMEVLASAGYIAVISDHRGHGESIRTKDDLGYFYDDGANAMVDDLHQITVLMKQHFPCLPFYLFGHSMGSMVVRCYTKRFDDELDGLIVCGSPSENKLAGCGKMLCKVMMKLFNDHHRSHFITNIAMGAFQKRFPNEKSKSAWICSDAKVVEAYDNHELCSFTFTLNGYYHLFSLMMETYDKNHWQLKNPQLPILFIAGRNDPCIVDATSFEKAWSFMQEVGYPHVQAKLYDGLRHEILNEVRKDEVYQDIISWLKEKQI